MSVFLTAKAGAWMHVVDLDNLLRALLKELTAHHAECEEDAPYTIAITSGHDGEDPGAGTIGVAHMADCDWTSQRTLK